jgi:hypothetical protein
LNEPGSIPHRAYGIAGFSVGARVAGGVIAAGYLVGLLPGPVVAVVGGLALITFGRALLVGRLEGSQAGAALAIAAGALGVGALRWGTLDLAELRSVQSVLGPTVLVGPDAAAAATIVAMIGAALAVAVWLLVPQPPLRLRPPVGVILEAGLAALAIVTVFIDPVARPLDFSDAGEAASVMAAWAGATVAATVAVLALALVLSRLGPLWRWGALAISGVAVVTGAALAASVL